MRATLALMVSTGAVLGLVSTGTARADVTHGAVAAADGEAVSTTAASGPAAGSPGDPSTTLTFVVTSGALTLSVPVSAVLGSGAPGTAISAPIGPCTVTDDRALLSASWTVTAAETNFTSGVSTIPATAAGYNPGAITTTGTITVTGTPVTLSNTAQPVLVASAGVGDNTATWDPTVTVHVPPGAVGGAYAGTLTQSVS